jgi:serine/threonine protein kinase
MIKDGLLGSFQAKFLLQGKYKGFFLGRYKILEQIGSGGMGCVYLCEHTHMKRKAAVKVLPASLAENSSFRERFYREARAVAALNHPNIVRAFDIDTDRNLHFLAMEYVEGSSLYSLVTKKGPLDVKTAVSYMRQAAAGLQHAFESGLVHRDIKPGNLLVDLFGNIKVLDMGLARFVADDKDDLSLRHDEAILGTADYLAPEQAINSRLADTRSDIYGLGCTLYFCLAGKPPFADGTTARKLVLHQTAEPKPLSEFRSDVPEEVVAVLRKCMAKKPEDRYQTPAELERAIAELSIHSGDTAVPFSELTLTKKRETKLPQVAAAQPAAAEGGRSWSKTLKSAGRKVQTACVDLLSRIRKKKEPAKAEETAQP